MGPPMGLPAAGLSVKMPQRGGGLEGVSPKPSKLPKPSNAMLVYLGPLSAVTGRGKKPSKPPEPSNIHLGGAPLRRMLCLSDR